jgi:hypothetical protein
MEFKQFWMVFDGLLKCFWKQKVNQMMNKGFANQKALFWSKWNHFIYEAFCGKNVEYEDLQVDFDEKMLNLKFLMEKADLQWEKVNMKCKMPT